MSIEGDARSESILRVENVSLRFGALAALNNVSLAIERGSIHSIIGPNGAGKTSLLNCLSGLYSPQEGIAVLDTAAGQNDLVGIKPRRVARLGLARTFQNLQLFRHLSVVDNLLLGRHIHIRPNLLGAILRSGSWRADDAANRAQVDQVIDLLDLRAIQDVPAGQLAYGLQKQVELARAVCLEPELLLLDEPMAGTTATERADMGDAIHTIRESGVSIGMIEHDIGVVMSMSDAVTVLSFGTVIASGTPEEVSADEGVIEAYLGSEVSKV